MSSLPIGGPPRPPTHQPISQDELVRLARALMERAGGQSLTPELLAAAADELGAPESHVYCAAGVVPMLAFRRDHEVTFVVCSGGCQQYGAVDVIDRLLAIRSERVFAGKPAFDVHTRGCLDRCPHGAMVAVFTGDGGAGIPMATPDKVAEVVADALDE